MASSNPRSPNAGRPASQGGQREGGEPGGLPAHWSRRWSGLARYVGLRPGEPLVLALSGGADSVLLLHLLRASADRPPVTAVHVDHGLRGLESDLDALFCARLCRELGVPFVSRRIRLDPDLPSLEARAREARYDTLLDECRRLRCGTLVTGHHADDGLETLLMRWIRGSTLAGLPGLRRRLELERRGHRIQVLRPLISLRREEVRRTLADAGLAWREDSSNADPRFTRNRVRNVLLPKMAELAGVGGIENLRAFGRAVEELEQHLAGATAYLAWTPTSAACACRSVSQAHLGGTLQRALLMRLPSALRRRALWRLLLEGTGHAPRRTLLESLLADLCRGRCGRHALPGGWSLQLRSASLELHPPLRALHLAVERARAQAWLPFPEPDTAADRFLSFDAGHGVGLTPPGSVAFDDGRRIAAELLPADPRRDVPRGRFEVELDPGPRQGSAEPRLTVRWARPGDRFHPLGAPGSRPLCRILADAGVPREERGRVPLVLLDDEIAWVAGLRPAEGPRVVRPDRPRLRLRLSGAAPGPETRAEADAQPGARPPEVAAARGQGAFWDPESPGH